MDRQFVQVYNKFTEAIRARNYSQSIQIAIAHKYDDITSKHIQHYEYLFRTTFQCIRVYAKDQAPTDIAILLDRFERLLAAASYESCQQFLSILNIFSNREYLNSSPSMLATAANVMNMEKWMRTISGHLEKAGFCARNADDTKTIFLALTQSALVIFKLENDLNCTRSVHRYPETRHYLDCCMKFACLRKDKHAADYVQCFELMINYVNACECDTHEWQNIMDGIIKVIAGAPKIFRATVVQDIAVTIAEFLQISKHQFGSKLNADRMRTIFRLVILLIEILRYTKYEKTFCTLCKSNVGLHEVDAVAAVCNELYKSAIEHNVLLDAQIVDAFSKIFAKNLMNLGELECDHVASLQTKALHEFRNIVTLCSTKERCNYVVPMFAHIFQNFAKIQLTKVKITNGSFNELFVLRKLYELMKSVENWPELIHVGYLMLGYMIVANDANTNALHCIMHEVGQKQFEHKDTIPFESPYDYWVAIAKGGDPIYRLKFPENASSVEMLLTYVKISRLYAIAGLEEFDNKCVNQLLMLAKKHEAIRCLRFVYHINKFEWDKVYKRIECLMMGLTAGADAKGEHHKRAVNLLAGAFDLATYTNRVTETTKKYIGLSLTEELNCTSRSTVFDEQTLTFERIQAQLLLNAKQHLQSFAEFYLGLSESNRSVYDDESKYLLRAFKDIARNFMYRDYEPETMDSFLVLYRLAKVANDEFGMIFACSHFAEHSATFRVRHGNLELDSMLDQCYISLVQNIEKIANISIRKQKELFFCMLNIALYHFEDNRIDDGKKIMQFVRIQMNERHIQCGVVEMKYYAVLLEMVTKYGQPSRFSALEFGDYIIQNIRKNIANVPAEDSINVPLILFTIVPAIVTFCLNRYENPAVGESMLLTVLKFALRSGYVRRSLNALILIGLCNLYQEKWQITEKRIAVLEQMCQISVSGEFTVAPDMKSLRNPAENVMLCTDPIRRDASTSVHRLSPYKVITDNVESHLCRYLQTSHAANCSCVNCFNTYNRFVLFQIACLYTRVIYLNESNAKTKQSIQSEIYEFWSNNFKVSEPFESNDYYHVVQARMLMWCAHFQWKSEMNVYKAKLILDESIEPLRKMRYFDQAMEHDLLGQIDLCRRECMTNSTTATNKIFKLNHKKGFIATESPKKQKNLPTVAVKKANRPFINLEDDDIFVSRPTQIKFHIHDDDTAITNSTAAKPTKTTRKNRVQKDVNKISDSSVVDLTSPPLSKTVICGDDSSPSLPKLKSNHANSGVTSKKSDEKLVQPAKATRKRTDKVAVQRSPVETRITRSRREQNT